MAELGAATRGRKSRAEAPIGVDRRRLDARLLRSPIVKGA